MAGIYKRRTGTPGEHLIHKLPGTIGIVGVHIEFREIAMDSKAPLRDRERRNKGEIWWCEFAFIR